MARWASGLGPAAPAAGPPAGAPEHPPAAHRPAAADRQIGRPGVDEPRNLQAAVRELACGQLSTAQGLRQTQHQLPAPSWATSTWTTTTSADCRRLLRCPCCLRSRQVKGGNGCAATWFLMRARPARPAAPAQSSVFHLPLFSRKRLTTTKPGCRLHRRNAFQPADKFPV